MTRDHTIRDPTYVNTGKPSESEYYEPIEITHRPDRDIKMDANPAYHATS